MWLLTNPQTSYNFYSFDVIQEQFLTLEELNLLEKIGDEKRGNTAAIGVSSNTIDTTIRDTVIHWLDTKEYEWLYRKTTDFFVYINKNTYNFDLTFLEALQYSVYNENQHYKAHVDMQPVVNYSGQHRKISFSLQLTNDTEYEGGDLYYHSEEDPFPMSRKRGTMNVFPSFALHKVTPVTKGQRRCIVGWLNGPRFK